MGPPDGCCMDTGAKDQDPDCMVKRDNFIGKYSDVHANYLSYKDYLLFSGEQNGQAFIGIVGPDYNKDVIKANAQTVPKLISTRNFAVFDLKERAVVCNYDMHCSLPFEVKNLKKAISIDNHRVVFMDDNGLNLWDKTKGIAAQISTGKDWKNPWLCLLSGLIVSGNGQDYAVVEVTSNDQLNVVLEGKLDVTPALQPVCGKDYVWFYSDKGITGYTVDEHKGLVQGKSIRLQTNKINSMGFADENYLWLSSDNNISIAWPDIGVVITLDDTRGAKVIGNSCNNIMLYKDNIIYDFDPKTGLKRWTFKIDTSSINYMGIWGHRLITIDDKNHLTEVSFFCY